MTARIQLIWYDVEEKQLNESMKTNLSLAFDDQIKCLNYIQMIPKTETIFLIVSRSSAVEILNLTHQLRQLDSIFLFTSEEEADDKFDDFIEKYSKIIGIFSHHKDLLESIEENIDLALQQAESFQFYEQQQKSTRELSKEAARFFSLRLFKHVVLQLPHNDQANEELIKKLKEIYRNNNKQLKWIDKFSREYKSEDAIRWYTRKPFLYKQLNRALRTEDLDLLYVFRYFISDLSKQLLQDFQHLRDCFSTKIYFYRGVILSSDEIEKLKVNVGRLISTNGYLSTSLSKDVALSYTDSSKDDKQETSSVLFEIEYDFEKINSIIIASIAHYSQHPHEEEVLFDFDAAFYLSSVTMDTTLNLILVKMSVSDEGTRIARDHLNEIETDIRVSSAVLVFGRLLAQLGQYEKSQDYFNRLLKNPGNEDISSIYFYMGAAYNYQGNYDQALEYYQIAYDMMTDISRPRPYPSSFVLNDMGVIYKMQGQFDRALDHFERALEIRQNYSEYPPIASCLENLAAIYSVKGDYGRALDLHRECLRIREEHLPKEHRQIAKTLGNIGGILLEQDQLNAALEYHLRSLKIIEKSLPTEHEDIALCYNRIALVLTNQGKYREALDYYTRALKIREEFFPHGHLAVTTTLGGIGYIYYALKNYTRALEYLHRALNLRETLFAGINDVGLVNILIYLGLVFIKLHQYGNALIYYKRALQVAQLIFPIGHAKLTDCWTNIGIGFREMNDYKNALEYFEKASKNEEENSIQSNRISLARIYDNMGICLFYQDNEENGLKYRMKAVRIIANLSPRLQYATWIDSIGDVFFIKEQLHLALECYFLSLHIRTECQSDNLPEMAQSFTNIAGVFVEMKRTPSDATGEQCSIKARFYYETALAIYQRLQHPSATDVLHSLGSMYEHMKRYHRALDYYRQGFNMCQQDISSEHIDRETFEKCITRVQWFIG